MTTKPTHLAAETVQSQQIERHRLTVRGVVQGVGFRPFVYGLATALELTGFVGNDSGGVFIEIEGPRPVLAEFRARLVEQPPPLAHIDSVSRETIPLRHDTAFVIVHSQTKAAENTLVSADVSICNDCLHEIFDPDDRRYGYPFTNCTHCGPRFTIIQDIPYDRLQTTMADFTMCPACQAEYDDPHDRRFHAQPNACPVCGPQVEFRESGQTSPPPGKQPKRPPLPLERGETSPIPPAGEPNAIHQAQTRLAGGGIVAVKGLGGFHLACDATNDQAVQTLRQRKGRIDKPFAVMAPDVTTIRHVAEINAQEERLLTGKERPIVLLKKKADSLLSSTIAPGNPYIGVMLPYTPLHYLLLKDKQLKDEQQRTKDEGQKTKEESPTPPRPQSPNLPTFHPSILVMTSANFSNEPIIKDNDEALERLAPLADAFLLHNRDIHIQCDDSVIRLFEEQELPIRRSRGYAPFPVKLPFPVRPTLAVGGELKATFCLTKGNYAFMSQHIGDMENLETLQAFERAVAHFEAIFRIEPEAIACDMHPGYLSSKWAAQRVKDKRRRRSDEGGATNRPPSQFPNLIKIQHHHAHIAAVMAENGLDGETPVIGFSFDGTGYGPDGAIWGGELLVADYRGFRRVAHLKYVPLPGGDAAVKRPYRAALAHLWGVGTSWDEQLPPVAACTAVEQGIIERQLESGLNAVPTSSIGRLFDGVAALIGVRQTVTYEAQAAIELEALATPDVEDCYCFDILSTGEDRVEIDPTPVVQHILVDLRDGLSKNLIAAKFHNAVAEIVLALSVQMRLREGLSQVALSGGVFQNVLLLEQTVNRLRSAQFEVFTHRLVPPNDGGLALGQAVIANYQ